jgi:hypothetical protein
MQEQFAARSTSKTVGLGLEAPELMATAAYADGVT